jgi:hypothetical protein
MLYFGSSVLYPELLAGLFEFVIWYCLLMSGGILCSTIGKDSFYSHRSEFLNQIIFHKVCRGFSGLVVIDFSCSKGRKTITTNLMIDSTYPF